MRRGTPYLFADARHTNQQLLGVKSVLPTVVLSASAEALASYSGKQGRAHGDALGLHVHALRSIIYPLRARQRFSATTAKLGRATEDARHLPDPQNNKPE